MKKRFISIILPIILSLALTFPAYGVSSLSNFETIRTYQDQFSDIQPNAWYYDNVCSVFEYGIMDGYATGIFSPSGNLTIAEILKLASMLHMRYFTGDSSFFESSPWYDAYVDYALENGIIQEKYVNPNAPATRSDFAQIIACAMPDEVLTPINRIVDGAIPDVLEYYSYGMAVYKLYRAGVLTGSDAVGTFYPSGTIRRAEAASIIMRIIKADLRQHVSLNNPLTAEQIYKLASPAVFFIEVFDKEEEAIKTGSGFFISESGLAVTNYHVIIGGDNAKVTLENDEIYEVIGVYDYDWKNDLALIQIDVDNVPYLEISDSSTLLTGATVYALGSPLGLMGSFSGGIISQSSRTIEGIEYIQLDAAISSGSSGGALLDTAGRVVGVTSATAVGGQSINLAMPINLIETLSQIAHVPLNQIIVETVYYDGHVHVPDFGAYFNIEVFETVDSFHSISYSYRLSDIEEVGDFDEIIGIYTHILEQNLFLHTSYLTSDGFEYEIYYNTHYDITLAIGQDIVRNRDCFTIKVS